jgi:3-hexulose-6-phosphate synthase
MTNLQMIYKPRLQLALDQPLSDGLAILDSVHSFVNIIEIGTPLIFQEGMHAVKVLREAYPKHQILGDLKIMDAGALEADIAFNVGADIVTVLALASDKTILSAVGSAKVKQKQVMADMIQVENLVERAKQILKLGVNILCVHTAYDLQSSVETPYKDLQLLRNEFPEAKIAIAGGVTLEKLDAILPFEPDTVVVGGAICNAANPSKTAKAIQEKLSATK